MRRTWAVAAGCLLGTALALAQTPPRTGRGGPELQALLDTPVGSQPAQEMHWPQVLDALGRPDDAARLRATLLDLWLAGALGEPAQPARSIAAWLQAARGVRPLTEPETTNARWAGAVLRHLQPRPAAAPVPVPAHIEALTAQLSEQAPGLWLHHDRQGTPQRLFAWVEFLNAGAQPFPLMAMQLRIDEALLDCDLPRGTQPALVAPGRTAGLVCRMPSLLALGRTPAATWWSTRFAAARWRAVPGPFAPEPQQRMVADALATPLQSSRDAWLQQRQDRIRADGEKARAEAAARQAASARREAIRNRLIAAGVLIGGPLVYALVARAFGRWVASGVLWLVGMAICVPMGLSLLRANWADSWGGIIAIPLALGLFVGPTVLAFLSAAIYTFVGRFWNDPAYRARVIWGFAALFGLIALDLLVRLLGRLF